MADYVISVHRHRHQKLSMTNVLLRVAVSGTVVAGPIICLSGLSFLATLTLLLISSPLLLLFSPILLGAGIVLVLALAGFGAAAAMAVVGGCAVGWIVSQVREHGSEKEKVWPEYLKRKEEERISAADNYEI